MPNHRSLQPWLPLIVLAVACNQGGEGAAGGQPDPGTGSTGASSTSTSGPDVPTTTIPTPEASSSGGDSTGTETGSTGGTSTGAEPGGSASSTTDPESPTCGDAKLDPGEACDLGFGDGGNDDQGACTLECKLAACGDGLIWAGKEACDNGPNNNNELYGGCTTMCQFGDRCNDGIVQGPEECDLGVDNGTDEFPAEGVPCDNGCRYDARLVFLSSTTYKGGEVGGVEGAHLKCKALADKAGFDNSASFMAWISDAQHSPAQDFKHDIDTVDLAYVLPNGVRIADDWNDLILNGPGDGIVVTETGEALLDKRAWTGTAPSGKVFDPNAHCKAWSSSSPADKSRIGRSSVDKQQQPQDWAIWDAEKQWTSFLSGGCNFPNRLYCVEQ